MNIFQIEAFLSLASTLSFTKSSLLLNTTQPNLSKIILSLEQEAGVQLVFRNNRDVRLTPAGRVFAGEMEKLIDQYHNALTKTKEAESGIQGVIKVGFLGTALVGILPKVVNSFNEKYNSIKLELIDYTYSLLMEALIENVVDIAFIPDRELNLIPNLMCKHIFSDDMCVALRKEHPMASMEMVDLSLLSGQPFVMMDPNISARDYDMVNYICIEHGFMPNIVHKANTLNNLLLMVECGIGITILAHHMKHFATENVQFVRIKGYENFFRIDGAWRQNSNPCIPYLLEVIDECIKNT